MIKLTCWLISLCFLPRVQCLSRALRLCELDLGLPTQTLREATERSCSPVLPQSEWAEDCDERGRRSGRGQVLKRARVCWLGRKLPPSLHILLHKHPHKHTLTFSWVLVFAVVVWCWGRFLRAPPHHHHHYTNTHTQPPLPSNTSPFRPSRPPNPAQSASSWRRQSMLRTPLSVSAQGRGKGPSAGDCGKSDLWCPRCCWPLTFFTPSLFIFPFVSPSLWLACFLLSVTYLFNSLLPVNVVALWKWDHWRSIWRGTRDKKVLHSGTIRW